MSSFRSGLLYFLVVLSPTLPLTKANELEGVKTDTQSIEGHDVYSKITRQMCSSLFRQDILDVIDHLKEKEITERKIKKQAEKKFRQDDDDDGEDAPFGLEYLPGIIKIVGSVLAGNTTAIISNSLGLIPGEYGGQVGSILGTLVDSINEGKGVTTTTTMATTSTAEPTEPPEPLDSELETTPATETSQTKTTPALATRPPMRIQPRPRPSLCGFLNIFTCSLTVDVNGTVGNYTIDKAVLDSFNLTQEEVIALHNYAEKVQNGTLVLPHTNSNLTTLGSGNGTAGMSMSMAMAMLMSMEMSMSTQSPTLNSDTDLNTTSASPTETTTIELKVEEPTTILSPSVSNPDIPQSSIIESSSSVTEKVVTAVQSTASPEKETPQITRQNSKAPDGFQQNVPQQTRPVASAVLPTPTPVTSSVLSIPSPAESSVLSIPSPTESSVLSIPSPVASVVLSLPNPSSFSSILSQGSQSLNIQPITSTEGPVEEAAEAGNETTTIVHSLTLNELINVPDYPTSTEMPMRINSGPDEVDVLLSAVQKLQTKLLATTPLPTIATVPASTTEKDEDEDEDEDEEFSSTILAAQTSPTKSSSVAVSTDTSETTIRTKPSRQKTTTTGTNIQSTLSAAATSSGPATTESDYYDNEEERTTSTLVTSTSKAAGTGLKGKITVRPPEEDDDELIEKSTAAKVNSAKPPPGSGSSRLTTTEAPTTTDDDDYAEYDTNGKTKADRRKILDGEITNR